MGGDDGSVSGRDGGDGGERRREGSEGSTVVVYSHGEAKTPSPPSSRGSRAAVRLARTRPPGLTPLRFLLAWEICRRGTWDSSCCLWRQGEAATARRSSRFC